MKCRETHYWLYSLRPNRSWPVDVVAHLQGCDECRRLQAKLKQIDLEVNKLTNVSSGSGAKELLLARIAGAPQSPAPPEPAPRRPWPWVRVSGALAASVALLLCGWWLGRWGRVDSIETIRTVEILRDKIVRVDAPGERELFAALLKRNARLVQSVQVKERLDTLLDMAEDCRQHALTLIEQGPRESLPFTIELYRQLLFEGVVGQVQQAPSASRPLLQGAVRTRLESVSEPRGTPKALPRVLAEQRDALQNTARQTMDLVDRPVGAAVALAKEQPSGPITPVAALVQFAIAFSTEADPVAKADSCSTCVNRLMPFMMLYLAEDGSAPHRADMGQQFGEMIQFGVYTPLAAPQVREPSQAKKNQTERIIQSTLQAVSQMEKNLEVAPEETKAALERALEVTKKGWEKHQGRGKGPPWLRDPFESSDPKKAPGKGKSASPNNQKGKPNQKKAGVERLESHDVPHVAARWLDQSPPSIRRACEIGNST